ncbi:unnamed protein product, partial [Mesorhabditis belari]|uniref:Target of EGR1 protein 1 n=1 Tax=Mesorhabditis belari TaxID=2138241 RepID=A0AAF3EN36_9BILA
MEADTRNATSRADLPEIPVFELTKSNFEKCLPYLLVSIKEADLIALDLEMSGLGPTYGLRAKDTETRYAAFRDSASTRGILSLGIATFKLKSTSDEKKRVKYSCQVFNILTYPSRPFTMEPDAMKFLLNHGFDFNKLTKDGVLYYPGRVDKDCPLRKIFDAILSESKPVALHNGFLDLCFLYHQLFADLPEKLEDFLASIADLFPEESSLIDSKYLAEYVTRMHGSYLEYVFRKCQRDNVSDKCQSRAYISMSFSAYRTDLMNELATSIERTNCELPLDFPNHPIPGNLKEHLCERYTNQGFCGSRDRGCAKLHDVDFALDLEILAAQKNRTRRKDGLLFLEQNGAKESDGESSCSSTFTATSTVTVAEITKSKPRIAVHGSHRAGVDAFMTGFAALFQNRMHLLRYQKCNPKWTSQLPLSGKQFPLVIRKSVNAVVSGEHMEHFFSIELLRKKKRPAAEKFDDQLPKE